MAGLNLRKEKVGLALKKRDLIDVSVECGFAVDASGSMEYLYKGGTVQDTLERMLALALRLDRDGKMPVWPFDTNSSPTRSDATEANYATFVSDQIPFDRWGGGTLYNKPLTLALDLWFPKKGGLLGWGAKRDKKAQPSLLLFVTDGANDDQGATEDTLTAMQNDGIPLYVSFVGIGPKSRFGFIERVAKKLDNVGFLSVNDIREIDDEALYERLVSAELATWLRAVA